jgi:molybdopterin molybdotransferase
LIQEEADRDGDTVTVRMAQSAPANIRRAGCDFNEGAVLSRAGDKLSGPRLALIAAGNVAELVVARRPRIAVIANGDELASPGAALGPDEIVSSIPYGLLPMIAAWGGEGVFLGVARDEEKDIDAMARDAASHDLVVPIGGASVGERDLMRAAFARLGFQPIFEKVAVKPGKPTWLARKDGAFVLGLPGNPASALVTARLFLQNAIKAMLGEETGVEFFQARVTKSLDANGPRETYLRASLSMDEDGVTLVTPFADQDSSLLSVLADSDALIRRLSRAPAQAAGALVSCLRFA